ncbi:MAG: hypothetical protein HYY41_00945 [Chloroflexi bacterium]|nr:hypothetical protein [Chloroflexota bacterium]MBI2979394.1 hypothetical protein [Chloroflexota bacterium]
MSSHTIIYLDQNYLSNMVKARAGSIADAYETKFWLSLFDDLKKAVLADKIACPESEFHLTETKYDKRLEEPIIEIINILSGGLQLLPWRSILESQIEDAARQFLGMLPEKRESWAIAFVSNPKNIQDIKNTRIINYVHPTLTNDDIEYDRQLKLGFNEEAQKMLEDYSSKPLEWPKLLQESKMSLIDGFVGQFAEQSYKEKIKGDYPLEDKLIAIRNYKQFMDFWDRIHQIGINPKDYDMVNSFVRSKELLDSPFIDINASIQAVIAERFIQGRKPKKGDFYDVPILSSILPYCDIVTTDRFMKEVLINKLHFDKKYKTRIFSATESDRLDFQELIRQLIN